MILNHFFVCMHVYVYVCMHVDSYVHVHMCIFVWVYLCLSVHMCMHVHLCMCVPVSMCVWACACACTCVCVSTHMPLLMHGSLRKTCWSSTFLPLCESWDQTQVIILGSKCLYQLSYLAPTWCLYFQCRFYDNRLSGGFLFFDSENLWALNMLLRLLQYILVLIYLNLNLWA